MKKKIYTQSFRYIVLILVFIFTPIALVQAQTNTNTANSNTSNETTASQAESNKDKDKDDDQEDDDDESQNTNTNSNSNSNTNTQTSPTNVNNNQNTNSNTTTSTSCTCDGKVNSLTLRYNGSETAVIKVDQRQRGTIFNQTIQPGGQFSLTGRDNQNTLGPEITVYINGSENTKIHTSCSQVIEVGQTYGSFTITAGTSRNNGALCVSENEPGTDIPEVSYPVLFTLIGGGVIGGLFIGFMLGKQTLQNAPRKTEE